jgi:signal transduction histidine kinase
MAEVNFPRAEVTLLHSQDKEQRRLARDLHDDVGQDLYAVKLALGRIRESALHSQARKFAALSRQYEEDIGYRTIPVSFESDPHARAHIGLRIAVFADAQGCV